VSPAPKISGEIIKNHYKFGISGKTRNDGKVSGTKKSAVPMIVHAKKTGHGAILG
jgi:hypothetical protein